MQNLSKPWPCGFKNCIRIGELSLEHSKIWKIVPWWTFFVQSIQCLEVYAHVKNCCLYYLVLAYFSFVSWFSLVTCFCAREIFSSKKGKQAWNCLDNLILLYYWRVPPSTSLLRIYLRTLIFICDHLWESLLFMKIFFIRENLFFFIRTLFESFLSVRTSSFYENLFHL